MCIDRLMTDLAVVAVCLVLGGTASAQMTLHVDDDAAPGGNGQEWSSAYKYLQDALNVAGSGDEIRVAGGVYRPDEDRANPLGTESRDATFRLKDGVEVYGGYAGLANPAIPDDRDVDLYESILSGDLVGNDVGVPLGQWWQLVLEPTRAENSYHVVTGSGTNDSAWIDGFTIVGGNANQDRWPASVGGGMYISAGNPTVSDCTFAANGAYGVGGGMYNHDDGNPRVVDCTFHGNAAGFGGGGMYNTDSAPTVTNCLFSVNSGDSDGGMQNDYGSAPTVTNCTFYGNVVYYGGGGISNGHGNVTVGNCMFIGNSVGAAWGAGGGMYSSNGSATVINCTFIANAAVNGAGMYLNTNSDSAVSNCIFWGDTQGTLGIAGSSNIVVSYSNIQGGQLGVYVEEGSILDWFPGNIDTNPLFVRSPDPGPDGNWDGVNDDYGDLHLQAYSPCIDAGDNDTLIQGIDTDRDGNPRRRNDPDVGDTGNGAAPIVDMSAYERQPPCEHDDDCEDGNVCTTESCVDTACQYTPVDEDTACSDGMYCNGEEACNTIGACLPGTPPCADGIDCTDDSCDEDTHECANEPNDAYCDDRELCNGSEVCVPDDPDAWPDGCVPGALTPAGTPCPDGLHCNGVEVCNDYGECLPGTPPCADGIDCTDDSCDEDTHQCANEPNGTYCDDGDLCSGLEACGPEDQGAGPDGCVPGTPEPEGMPCPGELFCNGPEYCVDMACVSGPPPCEPPDVCDEGLDQCRDACEFITCQAGEVCIDAVCRPTCETDGDCDNDLCNEPGICDRMDPDAGPDGCVPGTPEPAGTPCGDPSDTMCDDPDSCDGSGSCQEHHEPTGTPCLDGEFCNGEEACDNGVCAPGSYPCMEPNFPFCDELNGVCVVCPVKAVVYVDADANGEGDGMSWEDAYANLQGALDSMRELMSLGCCETRDCLVRVAGGVYVPDGGSGDREATFELVNTVALRGGYRGCPGGACGGGDPNERDIDTYETVLTGDLAKDDAAVICAQDSPDCDSYGGLCVDETCIIKQNHNENSYHVVMADNSITDTADTILDGFTITAGNADGDNDQGGGIYCSGSPTISNCTVRGNSASGTYSLGGGIYCSGDPTITSCTIRGNATFGQWGAGGGMFNYESGPALTDCTFSENSASRGGGGMGNWNSSPALTNCTFSRNSAQNEGGAVANNGSHGSMTRCTFLLNTATYGGAIFNAESAPTVAKSTFESNTASLFGGGVHNVYSSSPTFAGCIFRNNSAADVGGGMFNEDAGSHPTLTGCTFEGNSAGSGGGMYNQDSTFELTLTNCVFAGNSADYGGGISNYNSRPKLSDCMFAGNSALDGGGMRNVDSEATLSNCTFNGNTANGNTANDFGGGIFDYSSSTMLYGCMFSGNSADHGGGFFCTSNSNVILANCTFSGNTASDGGGMRSDYSGVTLTNCTFSGNSADNGGGISSWDSSLTITNSILWGDTPNEIFASAGGPVVTYTNIQDDWSNDACPPEDPICNIDTDPLFVRSPNNGGDGWGDDPATPTDESLNDDYGDLHVFPGSPCIDAGDNFAVPQDLADLDGNDNTTERTPRDLGGGLRFVDDCVTMDTGIRDPPDYPYVVDMGAYEHQPNDIDDDGDVDLRDFAKFQMCFTGDGPGTVQAECERFDPDCPDDDDDVDLDDFARFVGDLGGP